MAKSEPSQSETTDLLVQTLLSIWRQVMVEERDRVQLGEQHYPVSATGGKRLRIVDFAFEGHKITGVEQNPRTASRWAQMARRGVRIMQFMEGGRYLANVADGKLTLYH